SSACLPPSPPTPCRASTLPRRRTPRSTLSPYTTLFRSIRSVAGPASDRLLHRVVNLHHRRLLEVPRLHPLQGLRRLRQVHREVGNPKPVKLPLRSHTGLAVRLDIQGHVDGLVGHRGSFSIRLMRISAVRQGHPGGSS